MNAALTRDDVLTDLREATYITSMRMAPTSPKFALLLRDEEFTRAAETIVKEKIAALDATKDRFVNARGYEITLTGWQRLLAKIEDSLYQDGPKR